MKKLLIYIPSYNRYELLVRQITMLLRSIDVCHIQNIRIVVSDNASPDERYRKLASKFSHAFLKVTRNELNIGAPLNVIKGFEYEGFDYLWILSDDDEIAPKALAVISNEIGQGQHDFYYLKSKIRGDDAVADGEVLRSQCDYLTKFASMSMMGLISANIYPARLNKYLEVVSLYNYTAFPHVAGVFKLMGEEQFSLKCIGGNLLEWKPSQNSGSRIYTMAMTNALFLAELIENRNNRDIFISKHISDFGTSHFFPYAIRSSYDFKKAWAQVGLRRLLLVGLYYVVSQGRSRIVRLAKLLFPKVYAWYRKYKAGR